MWTDRKGLEVFGFYPRSPMLQFLEPLGLWKMQTAFSDEHLPRLPAALRVQSPST